MFNHRTISLGHIKNHVWERGPLEGNLVIVVIDDEWRWSDGNPNSVNTGEAILAQLRYQACKLPDVRAIGFFPLPPHKADVPFLLKFIQKKWLDTISTPDTRVRFLVDDLYGSAGDYNFEAANPIVETLTSSPYSYSTDDVAYLSYAGPGLGDQLLRPYKLFEKARQAFHAQRHGKLSPEIMSFFV